MDSEQNTMEQEKQNSHIVGEDLIEVDLAREFQDAIVSSKVLTFTDENLKNKVLNANKNQLIVLTSTINSPKLVKSVEYYDEEFIFNSL